ncbi:hypothetical protein MKY15_15670 [Sporosarcina sp. FSL K6-1540]|uniref:hypothetical protein n=1 Tax=Sporosarcina sp. FSL K6-1540 TaxID=2921555 RepID=UPI00315AA773
MNLLAAMNFNKQELMEQLRNGNTEVLKGLPASLTLQLRMELQQELGDVKDPSPIDNKAVARVVVDRLKDSGVKEMLLKRIEQEERENDPLA